MQSNSKICNELNGRILQKVVPVARPLLAPPSQYKYIATGTKRVHSGPIPKLFKVSRTRQTLHKGNNQ